MKPIFLLMIVSLLFSTLGIAQDPEGIIKEMKIVLPEIKTPSASFVHVVRTGNLLFLSGKGPSGPDGVSTKGKVGKDLTIEEGVTAARLVAIQQLAVLKKELGDLNNPNLSRVLYTTQIFSL